jgi:hypothetical protein
MFAKAWALWQYLSLGARQLLPGAAAVSPT